MFVTSHLKKVNSISFCSAYFPDSRTRCLQSGDSPSAEQTEKTPVLHHGLSKSLPSRWHRPTSEQIHAPCHHGVPGAHKVIQCQLHFAGRYRSGGPAEDQSKTPGPGRYDSTDPSVYLSRRPAFSMIGRHSVPIDSTQKPGPGTHNPEKVTLHKPRPPAFTLGIRHSEFVTPLVTDTSGRIWPFRLRVVPFF